MRCKFHSERRSSLRMQILAMLVDRFSPSEIVLALGVEMSEVLTVQAEANG